MPNARFCLIVKSSLVCEKCPKRKKIINFALFEEMREEILREFVVIRVSSIYIYIIHEIINDFMNFMLKNIVKSLSTGYHD